MRSNYNEDDLRVESRPDGISRADVDELLSLASKLRSETGTLDDEAIAAVSEATGAPIEYVRLAVLSQERSLPEQQGIKSIKGRSRSFYLSLDPIVRTYVTSGYLAMAASLSSVLGDGLGDRGGLWGILLLLAALGGAYNSAVAKDKKTATLAGAVFGGAYVVGWALLGSISNYVFDSGIGGPPPPVLLVFAAVGAFVGHVAHKAWNRRRHSFDDPADERRRLLSQLVELQDKLRSGEQTMSFLSVDVVGSTRMKELADPLAVEFTFSEYYRYIEQIIGKYQGTLHSTAGDGVTLAFEHPWQAFQAARNIQSGLVEFNQYRNRIGIPLSVRQGIHHGTVVPQGDGIQSINFALVIDIAAKLQKAAPEGGVAVSMPAAGMLPGGRISVGEEVIRVDNLEACIWRARVAPKIDPSAAPPPFKV